jgi:hypothetical protein
MLPDDVQSTTSACSMSALLWCWLCWALLRCCMPCYSALCCLHREAGCVSKGTRSNHKGLIYLAESWGILHERGSCIASQARVGNFVFNKRATIGRYFGTWPRNSKSHIHFRQVFEQTNAHKVFPALYTTQLNIWHMQQSKCPGRRRRKNHAGQFSTCLERSRCGT